MPLISADLLELLTRRILEAAGTPAAMAARVAEILVDANLTGHDSHGVLRIPAYLRQIETGSLEPAEKPVVLRESAAAVLVDARRGWGHYAAEWAMELATRKAAEAGSCVVVLKRCNHIGRLGEYVERAAAAGFIGSVMVGHGGRGKGCAAPLGGAERALGTNPIAFGVPTGDDRPLVIDFATTVVAEGKIQVARSKGTSLPEGCIVDRHGRPSVDPAAFYDAGSLLFAGGHKGYALSLFACLAGALSGQFDSESWSVSGVVIQAVDPAAFLSRDAYQEAARAFLAGIRSVRPAPGGDVLYPGEPERRARDERLACGIEIPETTWDQIETGTRRLGVALETPAS